MEHDISYLVSTHFEYNQIRMYPLDEHKMTFMIDRANYCYKVISFGLKNVGATYLRLGL